MQVMKRGHKESGTVEPERVPCLQILQASCRFWPKSGKGLKLLGRTCFRRELQSMLSKKVQTTTRKRRKVRLVFFTLEIHAVIMITLSGVQMYCREGLKEAQALVCDCSQLFSVGHLRAICCLSRELSC